MTEQEIKDRLAELYKAQEAATGWGAAVGARHEEIKALEGSLRGLQRPSSGTSGLRQFEDLKHAAENFRRAMIQSGATSHVKQSLYMEQLRALECALNPLNYRDDAQAAPEPLAKIKDALKPFADIPLIRDGFPNGPDMIDAPCLSITPKQVRAAREALALSSTDGGSRLTFCEACNGNTMHRRASIMDGVQTFECQRCALSSTDLGGGK